MGATACRKAARKAALKQKAASLKSTSGGSGVDSTTVFADSNYALGEEAHTPNVHFARASPAAPPRPCAALACPGLAWLLPAAASGACLLTLRCPLSCPLSLAFAGPAP